MLTRTGQYALRAMIHLARHECGKPITGKCIADESVIPGKYLSKVLGDLVRCGVLESTPGKNGGFRTVRPPEEISLFEVLAPFEIFGQQQCPFGNQKCGEDQPCAAHEGWTKVLDQQIRFLQETTVRDVSLAESGSNRAGS